MGLNLGEPAGEESAFDVVVREGQGFLPPMSASDPYEEIDTTGVDSMISAPVGCRRTRASEAKVAETVFQR
jgi:hypothetical protein